MYSSTVRTGYCTAKLYKNDFIRSNASSVMTTVPSAGPRPWLSTAARISIWCGSATVPARHSARLTVKAEYGAKNPVVSLSDDSASGLAAAGEALIARTRSHRHGARPSDRHLLCCPPNVSGRSGNSPTKCTESTVRSTEYALKKYGVWRLCTTSTGILFKYQYRVEYR